MKAAILGAGMSGLVAAKALDDMKISFDIFDKGVTNVSQQKGLHYLHGSIGLPLEPFKLKNFIVRPTNSELPDNYLYSIKVWGNTTILCNSLASLPEETIIYDFKEAYRMLLVKYSKHIQTLSVTKDMMSEIGLYYNFIISTIPLPILFPKLICEYKTVWVSDKFPAEVELKDPVVMYNITENVPWYRCSHIFGQICTEYTNDSDGNIPIKKIVTCEQINDNILHEQHIILAGRFGEWNRKRLVHEVYNIVQEGVKKLGY